MPPQPTPCVSILAHASTSNLVLESSAQHWDRACTARPHSSHGSNRNCRRGSHPPNDSTAARALLGGSSQPPAARRGQWRLSVFAVSLSDVGCPFAAVDRGEGRLWQSRTGMKAAEGPRCSGKSCCCSTHPGLVRWEPFLKLCRSGNELLVRGQREGVVSEGPRFTQLVLGAAGGDRSGGLLGPVEELHGNRVKDLRSGDAARYAFLLLKATGQIQDESSGLLTYLVLCKDTEGKIGVEDSSREKKLSRKLFPRFQPHLRGHTTKPSATGLCSGTRTGCKRFVTLLLWC